MEPESPSDNLLLFTPVVPKKRRHDGWTDTVQRAFVDALRRTGVVVAACRAVGRSVSSAYALRERAGADHPFVLAWDEALEEAGLRALDRAIELGRERMSAPIYRAGKQVGVREYWDNRLLLAAVNALDRLERRRPPSPALAVPGATKLRD